MTVSERIFPQNTMGTNIWLLKDSKGWTAIATDKSGNVVGIGNPYMQSIQIIKNIQTALQRVDVSLTDIVRIRIYTTNIIYWGKIGQAHLGFLKEIRPACTLVEVSHLISREILVEMEADAIVT